MAARMYQALVQWLRPRTPQPERVGMPPQAVVEALAVIVIAVTDTGHADGTTGLARHILQMRRRHQMTPLAYGSRLSGLPRDDLLECVRNTVQEEDLGRALANLTDEAGRDRRNRAWRYLDTDGTGGSTR